MAGCGLVAVRHGMVRLLCPSNAGCGLLITNRCLIRNCHHPFCRMVTFSNDVEWVYVFQYICRFVKKAVRGQQSTVDSAAVGASV